ncbi:MAG TPA: OmpA family protein [Puia sp.]|jgi:OOP family OmpA-OmpF porin|nr:OmpA family protein [Puia sp.]
MKTILLFVLLMDAAVLARSQSVGDVVKQQAGEGVKTGTAVATEQTANNVSNRLLNKLFTKKSKSAKADSVKSTATPPSGAAGTTGITGAAITPGSTSAAVGSTPASTGAATLTTYSKFDFVPGDKILVVEDFNQDAIGDFPDKWNTNSTGETQGVQGLDGKWFSVTKRGIFVPEFINSLPDNFTLQFDLLCGDNIGYGSGNFGVSFDVIPNPSKQFTQLGHEIKRDEVAVWFQPFPRGGQGLTLFALFSDDLQTMNNEINQGEWIMGNAQKRLVKISFWRQRQRLRVYMNEQKVWDLPRAFETGKNYNSVLFRLSDDILQNGHYLFSNLRLAAGAPDTRNKLITEGKFSTTGILFDINSATVKGESYGALKDIADVLKDNATVQVKIVGHTDSDGDAAANLTLSQKRAAAVKDALVREFGIDATRIQTDGKGATQPLAPNTTPTGKAQNRRVEFIKV